MLFLPPPPPPRRLWITLVTVLVASSSVCCGATVVGDALYRSVLSSIPSITFVTATPPMTNDTSVYFSGFAWPSNRTAQQVDYVSVPVAVMALCLAVQPDGAVNLTTTPTMSDIADLLLGRSTGAAWLRTDWSAASRRVSKVYWAASSSPPLVNALKTWTGAPFTSSSIMPTAVGNNPAVTVVPTDADVAAALLADPNAIAFLPLIAAVQAKVGCLSLSTPTSSGGIAIVAPQLQASSAITVSNSLAVTCPVGAGCYPLLGSLVAHVRKRASNCDTSSSLLPVIFAFVSSTSSIAAPLSRWSMLFPPTATQMAALQTLTASVCMPETVVLASVGGVLRQSSLNNWFYQYFVATNGTVFVNFTSMSSSTVLAVVATGGADFATGSALSVSDRASYPMLHSYPSLAAPVSLIANLGRPVTLQLPRCSITSIFNGTIQWWNDTAIQAVNPMLVMPRQRIDVTMRIEPALTTNIFMAGLRSLDVECFGTTNISPTTLLPNISRASLFTGNTAVANYVTSTPYTLSWTPADYANTNSLNQISIEASDGSVSTPADVRQSSPYDTFDPITSDFTLAAQAMTYPFVGISSFVQPLIAAGNCQRDRAVADFVIWTLSSATAMALTISDKLQPLPSQVRSVCVDSLVSSAMCNGALLYPVAPVPLLWWPIALAVGLFCVLCVAIGGRAGYRHWVYGVRPTDPTKPIAVMFVGVKNQAAVTEAGEANAAAVLRHVANTTRTMVRKHRCYEARRVDAWTTMIVAKTAQAAVACAEDIVLGLSVDVQWIDDVMTHPMPSQGAVPNGAAAKAGAGTSSARNSTSRTSSKDSGSSAKAKRRPEHKSPGLKEQSRNSRTTSSNSRLTINQCVPQIYAGVHWAHVMIDESQDDIVSYYGAGIATAATVADLAVDGQVVVSREVVDQLSIEQTSPAPTDVVFSPLNPIAVDADDGVTALSMTTSRFPEWLLQRAAARRKSLEEHGADAVGNTIAAAMASADGALAKRRIAVVSLLMRDLVQDSAEGRVENRAAVVREALEGLREIVTTHRGEIHSISDGVVTVTIGASGPVAMAAVRAAQIATDASDLCLAAGVHCGPALVGNAMGGKPAAVGRIISGAALMRLVATKCRLRAVATDAVHADLSARFQLATVDLIATPWDLEKRIRCYGVVEERADNGEGEWLYELSDGFAPLERRFDEYLLDKAPPVTPSPPVADNPPPLASPFLSKYPDVCELSDRLSRSLHAEPRDDLPGFLYRRLVAVVTFFGTTATVV